MMQQHQTSRVCQTKNPKYPSS